VCLSGNFFIFSFSFVGCCFAALFVLSFFCELARAHAILAFARYKPVTTVNNAQQPESLSLVSSACFYFWASFDLLMFLRELLLQLLVGYQLGKSVPALLCVDLSFLLLPSLRR
jgi:hypothetical protein